MAEKIPSGNAERLAQGYYVTGIELDAACVWGRGDLGGAAAALIKENDLAGVCEGGEPGPEKIVTVDHAAIDAAKRERACDGRRAPHGKLEAARFHA
jgi:hypothetical protein